jgi:amidase
MVQRFGAASAHVLGQTNVPLNLGDFQSYNEIYRATGNPWDTSRTPGESSGGSAASLAAGFCGLEAGSYSGGSIRNPAHYCDVYGDKPTYGIVPMQGHDLVEGAPQADLAVRGPLARSADDLAVALDIMAGPAQREAVGWQLSLPKADFSHLKQWRVAIWPADEVALVTTETADRAVIVGETLSKLGATVSDTARPLTQGAW